MLQLSKDTESNQIDGIIIMATPAILVEIQRVMLPSIRNLLIGAFALSAADLSRVSPELASISEKCEDESVA